MQKASNIIALIAITAVLFTSLCAGASYAKYVADKQIQGTVIITAELGHIGLSSSQADYLLIPGYDFTIENTVAISQKSAIAAYVYVEVCDNFGSDGIVAYIPSANWHRLSDVTGKNGGAVYCYSDPIVADTELPFNLTVIVSQYLKNGTTENEDPVFPTGNLTVSYFGYMAQTASGQDAISAYCNSFLATP